MTVRDGFILYNFEMGESIGLEVETVSVNKRVISSDEVPASLILPAVSVYFRSGVSQTTLEAVWRDYDKYCGLTDNPGGADDPAAGDGVNLDALLGRTCFVVRWEMLVM